MNKRIITAICLLMFAQSLFSQLISEDKLWKTQRPEYDMYGENLGLFTKTYFFHGDSILNGKLYSKLYWHRDSIRTIESEITLRALMREEGEQVFQYYNSDTERMVYDFNWQENDTLYSTTDDVGWPIYSYIKEIDTVEILGIPKKRFMFYSGEVDLINGDTSEQYFRTILEDYGDLRYYLIFPFCQGINFDCVHQTICIEDQGQVIYQKPDIDYCYINTVITSNEKLIPESQVNIFPNLVEDLLTINLIDNQLVRIAVFNIQGKEVKYFDKISDGDQIDLSDINAGIYFLKIENDDYWTTKKFMKI